MDKEYESQLKAFGDEQIQLIKIDQNKKRQQERQEATNSTISSIMSSVEGRRWAFDFLDMCRVNTAPIIPGKPDMTAFYCGVQAVGHELLKSIMVAVPELYHVMIQEEAARRSYLNRLRET